MFFFHFNATLEHDINWIMTPTAINGWKENWDGVAMGPTLVRRRAWRGVQTVLPMKGTMRTSIQGDAGAPGFSIGESPRFVLFFTAMRNMQTDKPNFLFEQDQPYHPSYLFSEHRARVFLLYSSPLA